MSVILAGSVASGPFGISSVSSLYSSFIVVYFLIFIRCYQGYGWPLSSRRKKRCYTKCDSLEKWARPVIYRVTW